MVLLIYITAIFFTTCTDDPDLSGQVRGMTLTSFPFPLTFDSDISQLYYLQERLNNACNLRSQEIPMLSAVFWCSCSGSNGRGRPAASSGPFHDAVHQTESQGNTSHKLGSLITPQIKRADRPRTCTSVEADDCQFAAII